MSALTHLHRRALAAGMADIERRIADLEAALGAQATPLAEYTDDFSADQHRVIRRCFAEIRAAMVACARDHDIPLERRKNDLRWIMQSGLSMLRVAVDDLGERRLKGYGPVSEPALRELAECQNAIGALVDQLIDVVRPPATNSDPQS